MDRQKSAGLAASMKEKKVPKHFKREVSHAIKVNVNQDPVDHMQIKSLAIEKGGSVRHLLDPESNNQDHSMRGSPRKQQDGDTSGQIAPKKSIFENDMDDSSDARDS